MPVPALDGFEACRRANSATCGFAPLRGFRRLGVRVFGADVSPPTRVWSRALDYELTRMSRAVGTPHRDAALVQFPGGYVAEIHASAAR